MQCNLHLAYKWIYNYTKSTVSLLIRAKSGDVWTFLPKTTSASCLLFSNRSIASSSRLTDPGRRRRKRSIIALSCEPWHYGAVPQRELRCLLQEALGGRPPPLEISSRHRQESSPPLSHGRWSRQARRGWDGAEETPGLRLLCSLTFVKLFAGTVFPIWIFRFIETDLSTWFMPVHEKKTR